MWLNGVVFAAIGVLIGIGNPQVVAALSSPVTQQVDGNGVAVIATLVKGDSASTAIKLSLDTYFVNLVRYDFGSMATLRDDTGRTYTIAAVEPVGSQAKPHFRQAVLRFPKVAPEAKVIELVVKDVAGVKERVFRWVATAQ